MIKHEKYIKKCIDDYANDEEKLEELRKYHDRIIDIIQHERLIHLLVTMFFGFLIMFVLLLSLFLEKSSSDKYLLGGLGIILIVVEMFYIRHYYRLENTLEKWYKIGDDISKIIR